MKYFVYCRKSTESEDRQVLSLGSQQSEADKILASYADIDVVARYEESQSAKKPGRPIFDAMLARIEQGEAHGIITWHPDRLARNALDGARVIDLLDRGKLKDLKFSTYSFENNAQGKLMLFTIFGFSKYYVDSLSDNIKRGNRKKAALGWRPSRPPIGYLHDHATKTIVRDPERFDLVRQMFRLMLSGTHTPRSVHRIAKYDWGLRTLKRKSQGGALLHLSSVNTILRNSFYAGVFPWEGKTVPGSHESMITLGEFDRVQAVFRRPLVTRSKRWVFAYTGLLRCGRCGLAITAERKRNRYGRHYVYYHCTRSKHETPCRERYIQAGKLEEQMIRFLESLRLAPNVLPSMSAAIEYQKAIRNDELAAQQASIETSIQLLDREINTLTDLRVRDLLSDDEFTKKRIELTRTRLGLVQQRDERQAQDDWSEHLRTLVSFSNEAVEYFRRGDDEQKRLLMITTSSNPTLKDKILSIEARKPFIQGDEIHSNTEMRTFTLGIRTFFNRDEQACTDIIANVQTIVDRDAEIQQTENVNCSVGQHHAVDRSKC